MGRIDSIADCLTQLDVRYQRTDEEVLGMGFGGQNCSYEILISTRGPLVSLVSPRVASIPVGRQEEVIRLANLINGCCLHWGAFWVETTRRQLCFELAFVAPEEPTRDHLGHALGAMTAIDFFYPCFAQVIWAGRRAEEALDRVRTDLSPADARQEDQDERPDEEGGLDIAI